jgi:hypothetical protein
MGNVEFSDAYPSHPRVVIPPFFVRQVVARLIPGDIVFPDEEFFMYERSTGVIYVDQNRRLREDDIMPSDMTDRAGLTRVRGPYGNEFMSGYVADFRNLESGSIAVIDDNDFEEPLYLVKDEIEDEADKYRAELDVTDQVMRQAGYRELLAAVFNDPDDRPHFVGLEVLKPAVVTLMNAVDKKIQETEGVGKAPKMEIPAEERAIAKLKRQQNLRSKDRRADD